MKHFISLLLFALASMPCMAFPEEQPAFVAACLYFESGDQVLTAESNASLEHFVRFAYKENPASVLADSLDITLKTSTNSSGSSAIDRLAFERQGYLLNSVRDLEWIRLTSLSIELNSDASRLNASLWNPHARHYDHCDALVRTTLPVDSKQVLCGNKFGRCAVVCKASGCLSDSVEPNQSLHPAR